MSEPTVPSAAEQDNGSPSSAEIIERLTRQCGELVQQARLSERDLRLVSLELHDGPIQELAAALMYLDAARAQLTAEPSATPASLDEAARLVRSAMDEIRRLMRGLRPLPLEMGGMAAAIEVLVAEQRAAGREVGLDLQLPRQPWSAEVETAVYRIVQEALNNVRRHSGSQQAQVSLRQVGADIEITVQDWGHGFDPQKAPADRWGLDGIRARAEMFGGTAAIDSQPGRGTIVRATLKADRVSPHNR
jgi:signal transduction histidine kinase